METFSVNLSAPHGFSNEGITVEDTTQVISPRSGTIDTRKVPGRPDERYVAFGPNDQLPYKMIDLIGSDEVTSQNKLFNVLTCYGSGLQFLDKKTKEPTENAEVENWLRHMNMPEYVLEQATDMKYYYYTVSVFILNKDRTKINRIVHKDACFCRFAPADKHGIIPFVYYADWQNLDPRKPVEKIPLLDPSDPWGDLLRRVGLEPDRRGKMRPERGWKFAILTRFPTAGCQYYPIPYYAAIFRGGSFDEKRLISKGKRAKLENHSSFRAQVEIEKGYWDRICAEEGITDPKAMKERINKERKNIEDYVVGLRNSGKLLFSQYMIDPMGHEVRDVRIQFFDNKKEGGDWSEDTQAASNTICYADNVHPNLVGAVPGKSQSNNSGSDKRELFTMKEWLETAFHHVMIRPLEIVCWFNGWDVKPSIKIIKITTLDEHTDAKEINPEKVSHGNND